MSVQAVHVTVFVEHFQSRHVSLQEVDARVSCWSYSLTSGSEGFPRCWGTVGLTQSASACLPPFGKGWYRQQYLIVDVAGGTSRRAYVYRGWMHRASHFEDTRRSRGIKDAK